MPEARRAIIRRVVRRPGKMPMAEATFTDDENEKPVRFPVSETQKEESSDVRN